MEDLDPTSMFTCPCCAKKDIKSWAIKREDGIFHCGGCGSKFRSRASALEDCPKMIKLL